MTRFPESKFGGTCALVIGFGSIGARHADILRALGASVVIVSRRAVEGWPNVYRRLDEALANHRIEVAIVANETSVHLFTLRELRNAGFDGPTLVEKPLFSEQADTAEIAALLPDRTWVAYNLRFHPALQELRNRIDNRHCVSATIYAGQNLYTWRVGRDIESSYSSSRKMGGGVLRDLSHELDYAAWLFGPAFRLTAHGGNIGPLPIDSDDSFDILAETPRCRALNVHIDYYHRPGARSITVHVGDETLSVDLIANQISNGADTSQWQLERNDTYTAQLLAFLDDDRRHELCRFEEGLQVVRTIEAAESAAKERMWVTL